MDAYVYDNVLLYTCTNIIIMFTRICYMYSLLQFC